VKQQYTGPYTFDLAARTITLAGIEVPQDRLALIVNSTVGFIYHNLENEPTAQVTISGGNTIIVFPQYKDCETHGNSDALSIFYDDGVDLGQLIKDESDETQALLQAEFDETQTALSDFRAEVKAESDETQALLQAEFEETQVALADFQAEVKAESDATQTLLQVEFDETQTALADFRAEVKAESDEAQALLQAEFDQTQTALTDFRTEVKAESDETQALLQAEFDQTQTAVADFRTEVKAESDATQTLLQTEFDQTQTAIVDFRTEVKAESDATQALLNLKLAGLINGFLGIEHLVKYSAENGVEIDFTPGGYGPSKILFLSDGIVIKSVQLTYDLRGRLILIEPIWTPEQIRNELFAWYDPSDLTKLTLNGLNVSKLDDKSPTRNDALQATAVQQPTIAYNAINSLPALNYTQASQRLKFSDLAVVTDMSVASVFTRSSADINTIDVGSDSINNRPFGIWWGTTNFVNSGLGSGINTIYGNSLSSGTFISYSTRTSLKSSIFLNGVQFGASKDPLLPNNFLQNIGYRPGANQTHQGYLGEIIITSNSSLQVQQKIEGYLAHKWGLTANLPPTHPYKISEPVV
jgi:uncharacterized protein YbaA (DUF1428 family)